MIGDPQRAFYGAEFGNNFPLFVYYGVPLWVPEVGGATDPDNEAHDLIMSVFGGMSKGERNRIKVRAHAAMSAQALREGRYLGGRPSYGYRLVPLGPHPNPAKARRTEGRTGAGRIEAGTAQGRTVSVHRPVPGLGPDSGTAVQHRPRHLLRISRVRFPLPAAGPTVGPAAGGRGDGLPSLSAYRGPAQQARQTQSNRSGANPLSPGKAVKGEAPWVGHVSRSARPSRCAAG
ncbi:hypothetical protein ACTPOK_08085 [Streptomyces inhibens]|uniref:hypothetical protein n=1 Tax=Streptomyces inhibens TaxID=2293571 RepID=UPI00402AFD12